MKDFKSILLATDFRSTADETVKATVRLALRFDANVSLLHVLEPAGTGAAVHFYHQQIGERLMQGTAHQLTAQGVKLAGTHLRSGPFAETIVHAGEAADLTVLGAGERTPQGDFQLGPIAENVVTHAARPTLLVRAADPELHFQRILCAVDHSEAAGEALRYALRLADLFGGQLTVLSVIPEVSWLAAAVESGGLVDVQRDHAAQWKQEFEQFLSRFDFAGVPVEREVRSGVVHDAIIAAARLRASDLLVMGTTGRSRVARILLGSTTRRVFRRIPCSLLTVKGTA